MSKTVKIIFTLSLAANLLFIGMAMGRLAHDVREPRPWDETKAALAGPTQDVLRNTFKEKGKEVFPLFKEAREKKQAMKEVITAADFDEGAYDALAADFLALNNKLTSHRLETIKAILSQLPQEERAKLADHTLERLIGNPRRPRHDHRDRSGRMVEGVHRTGAPDYAKHGAIEKAPGKEAFEINDTPANQGE